MKLELSVSRILFLYVLQLKTYGAFSCTACKFAGSLHLAPLQTQVFASTETPRGNPASSDPSKYFRVGHGHSTNVSILDKTIICIPKWRVDFPREQGIDNENGDSSDHTCPIPKLCWPHPKLLLKRGFWAKKFGSPQRIAVTSSVLSGNSEKKFLHPNLMILFTLQESYTRNQILKVRTTPRVACKWLLFSRRFCTKQP